MKLIGAGLPRTATLSQKVALEMLGVGPCYHMVNVLADLGQVPLWHRAADGEIQWEEIFEGFESSVDWPGGFFYRELMDAYPGAKVLLSVRDPEPWERSMRQTVWGFRHGDTLMTHLSDARADVDSDWAELQVPGHWRNSLSFADSDGPLLMRTQFELDQPAADQRAWIVLDGIFYQADVWFDGVVMW